jgi:beta-phosphoglucomutase-like phosphatase (HAD superfamily)
VTGSDDHHTIAWSRALRDHGCNARLAAIHRLVGMGSSQLLETFIGHEASARAGLARVALETGGFSRPELEAEGVIAVYRDPADLLDQLDDSPIGRLAGS